MSINFKQLGTPSEFWEYFDKISQIPRCSGREHLIREYIKKEADKFNLISKTDTAGNLLVSASLKKDGRPMVIVQSHLDMVCEKNENIIHDFLKDPLKLKIVEIDNNKWITAEGTTLGADNGVGLAYSLALMKKTHSGQLNFGNIGLDLLFTVGEEEGLPGALQIDKDFLQGTYLINTDSGLDDTFIIGCAGGIYTFCEVKLEKNNKINQEDLLIPLKIFITGLKGGHSAGKIHLGRANSIKLISEILRNLNEKYTIYIHSINGGNKPNAIPREATSILYVKKNQFAEIFDLINSQISQIKKKFAGIENDITISVQKLNDFSNNVVFSSELQSKLLTILNSIPNGPMGMHPKIKNIVHTSTNLASIITRPTKIKITSFQRSFEKKYYDEISDKIVALFKLPNLKVKLRQVGGVGEWTPDFDSQLLAISKEVYFELFNKEPNVTAVHGALECGLFTSHNSNLECIAIGPNAKDAHSPEERLEIQSVEKTWKFLTSLLKTISSK